MALLYKHEVPEKQFGEILQETEKFNLERIKKYIKEPVTYLQLQNGLVMFINGAAQILHVHFNPLATRTIWNAGLVDAAIYGDVLVLDLNEIDSSIHLVNQEKGNKIA